METDRLILRDYKESDLADMHRLWSDKETMFYLNDILCHTLDDTIKYLKTGMENADGHYFCITEKGADRFIGSIGYTITDTTPLGKIVHMGYMMMPEYHGRGYMTEATKKVIEFAFTKDNCIRITTGCVKEHEASRKVIEKAGFRKESEKIKAQYHDGIMKDRLEYAINKEEFVPCNWREKLDIFMSDFKYTDDVIGILVCGSFVTGKPTNHSDLDVHIILDNTVGYRERGNRIINGLLIEYFANPPKQILRYFEEDFSEKSLMSQTQFATGEILLDKTGEVAALKEKAKTMIADFYCVKQDNFALSDLDKYGLWDMMDDLQDAYENKKADFDFLYFNNLNTLIKKYMRCINFPYNKKTIYGNITDCEIRKKYLLRELPNAIIKDLIVKTIVATPKSEKMDTYEKLTTTIINDFGGFNIDGFTFKSNVEGAF